MEKNKELKIEDILDLQYYKFSLYGFLKNMKFFEPFVLLFFVEKGLSFFYIGLLYFIREIVTNVFEIPSGIFADSYGRKNAMIMSFFFYIFSFLVFSLSSEISIIFLGMILYSLGESFRTGTHKAMIFDYLKTNGWEDLKLKYYGRTRGWAQVGAAISSIISIFIVFYSGTLKYIFLISVIPYMFSILLFISYPSYLNKTKVRKEKEIDFFEILRILKKCIKEKKILKILLNVSIFSGYLKTVKDYIQPVMKILILNSALLSWLNETERLAIFLGILYFFIHLLGGISSRTSDDAVKKSGGVSNLLNFSILIGFTIGIFLGLFINLHFILLGVFIYFLFYIIENLRSPAGVALVTSGIDEDILASVLSLQSQFKTIMIAFSAPFMGFIADNFGIGTAIGIISFCYLFIAFFLLLDNDNLNKKNK